jgi:hypothetical protein
MTTSGARIDRAAPLIHVVGIPWAAGSHKGLYSTTSRLPVSEDYYRGKDMVDWLTCLMLGSGFSPSRAGVVEVCVHELFSSLVS